MRKQCKSTTTRGAQCTKSTVGYSFYYIFHQDPQTWILFIAGIVITIIITIVTIWYQDKRSEISVSCKVNSTGDPSKIVCEAKNYGRTEARDVFVSFNHSLPVGTKIFTSSPGLEIKEANVLPNPNLYPNESKIRKAFSVFIPRIPKGGTVEFVVQTEDQDNKRAAEQSLIISSKAKEVVESFINAVKSKYPLEIGESFNFENYLSYRSKEENFYLPDKFSYENGIFDVEFFLDSEIVSKKIFSEAYTKHMAEFIELFKKPETYKAPVVKIKVSEGESTYAIFPPFISTYNDVILKVPEKGQHSLAEPAIPASYN